MNRLEEIVENLEAAASELENEGVNIVDYWLARTNIEHEDFEEFLNETLAGIVDDPEFAGLKPVSAAKIFITHGFLAGLMYGRGKEESEF
jgi:hypothetical protein